MPQLPDAERDRNLEMLRFISEQTTARGMDFQLGVWMHGYQWIKSPNANYTIEGLTADSHGPYCRDAVRALLQAVPKISGVTFRVHGESGVQEGSYQFWKTVFDGVATCGRKVEIDMHAKGMDQGMIDAALRFVLEDSSDSWRGLRRGWPATWTSIWLGPCRPTPGCIGTQTIRITWMWRVCFCTTPRPCWRYRDARTTCWDPAE